MIIMSDSIYVRVTPQAKHVLAIAAAKKGLSPAAFVRQAALEAAKHMGSELEPDEETIAALKDDTEPVIKMKPVLRPLHSVSNVRPLLREDIERQKREARPGPMLTPIRTNVSASEYDDEPY